MKKIAIMQPYFYPYIGYFEMVKSVDAFVFLTDVQYVRRSWMCRNRIRSHQEEWQYIRVGVKKAPQESLICNMQAEVGWLNDMNKTLLHVYGQHIKSHPLYADLQQYEKETDLCKILCKSVEATSRYLGIKTEFLDSRNYRTIHASNQDGILELVENVGGNIYINASGGTELYQKSDFANRGIELLFMQPCQNQNKLSILDLIFGDGLTSL